MADSSLSRILPSMGKGFTQSHLKLYMMRKIKNFILAFIVMTITPTAAYSQTEKEVNNLERVMKAIIQVESKGNPRAHNPKGDCAGILQITPGLVKQCNAWLKAKKSKKRYTLSDRYNVEKSKEMFFMYQKYYNPSNDVEKSIRIWNGGPGYKMASTNGYYRKVMKYYNKEKGGN